MAALLTIIYVSVLFTIARLTGLMTIWALNLIVGLFLVTAGYQLSPLLNVLRLWLWRVWNVVVLVVEALWLGLVRLLHGIVLVLEHAAFLLATPLERMFGGRGPRQRPPEPPVLAARAAAGSSGGTPERGRPILQ